MACNFPKVSILSKNFFQLAKTLRVDLLSYSRIFHSFACFSRTRERDMDKTQLTALLQFIKSAPDNDSLTATILRLTADSISLDTLKSLAGSKTAAVSTPQKEPDSDKASGYLHFSKKELSDMPKSFQKSFIYDNRIVKYRYYNGLFQARYRKQGYNIEVASKDFDTIRKTQRSYANAGYSRAFFPPFRRIRPLCRLCQRLARHQKADDKGFHLPGIFPHV